MSRTKTPTDDEWQRLIGRAVRTPEHDRGTVIGPAGDWDKPGGRGWFVVMVPRKGQRVYHISELELLGER